MTAEGRSVARVNWAGERSCAQAEPAPTGGSSWTRRWSRARGPSWRRSPGRPGRGGGPARGPSWRCTRSRSVPTSGRRRWSRARGPSWRCAGSRSAPTGGRPVRAGRLALRSVASPCARAEPALRAVAIGADRQTPPIAAAAELAGSRRTSATSTKSAPPLRPPPRTAHSALLALAVIAVILPSRSLENGRSHGPPDRHGEGGAHYSRRPAGRPAGTALGRPLLVARVRRQTPDRRAQYAPRARAGDRALRCRRLAAEFERARR